MYHLPQDEASVDLAILHLVLHYSDNPGEVIYEASRVLRPGGRLIVVDFAVHTEEYLRNDYQHHRLGFTDSEIRQYFELAGISVRENTRQLVGDPLTIKIWVAQKPEKLLPLRAGQKSIG
jgi:ubiquinone/menaquinone biosynthesis C-methylase UbiE